MVAVASNLGFFCLVLLLFVEFSVERWSSYRCFSEQNENGCNDAVVLCFEISLWKCFGKHRCSEGLCKINVVLQLYTDLKYISAESQVTLQKTEREGNTQYSPLQLHFTKCNLFHWFFIVFIRYMSICLFTHLLIYLLIYFVKVSKYNCNFHFWVINVIMKFWSREWSYHRAQKFRQPV